jgi:5'-nucleotidase
MSGLILVTNDDGIDAPGLHVLAAVASAFGGYEVVVAAPIRDASGSSAAITSTQKQGRVVVQRRDLPDLCGVRAYAIAGTPAFITLIASRGAFGAPPALVLSGVNDGANVGRAILHSGTVGAALTACLHGAPALAVSLDTAQAAADGGPAGEPHWATAAQVAGDLLALLLDPAVPVAVNVNVPDRPAAGLAGRRYATLAPFGAFGAVQTNVEISSGFVRLTIADTDITQPPDSDAALLAQGFVAITELTPLTQAPPGRWRT